MRYTAWTIRTAAFLLCHASLAQHFIDLRSVRTNGEGWPPDPAAHSLIVDSVITVFDPRSSVGSVMKGMGNRPTNAFIQGDPGTEIHALLDRLHTGGTGGRHIVLKIDTLYVSEDMGSARGMAYCRFSGEVLERTDSGWTALYAYGTTLANSGGMDATDDHAANIAHALDNCLRRTAKVLAGGLTVPRSLSARQLGRPYRRRQAELRSLRNDSIAEGIYFSFMDLVDGTPDTTTAVKWKTSPNTTETTRVLRPKGEHWEFKAWGYSDGRRLYVNTGREYNEVHIGRDGLYTYWTPPSGKDVSTGAVVGAGLMFGLIGAGIATAASPNTGGTPVRVDVDLTTGSLRRTHGQLQEKRASEHWFCYSGHSQVDTAACLFIYGGEEACLRKSEYHVVKLVPRVDPVPIELQAAGRVVQVDLDTNTDTDEVYLVSVKEDGTLKVDKVNPAMASSIISGADPEKEVK